MKNILAVTVVISLAGILQAFAGDDASKDITTSPPPPAPLFRAGGHEVELLGGALFSVETGNRHNRPQLDYSIQELRYGWMLNDLHGPGFWHGNEELLLDGFAGEVFKGPKGGMGGATMIIRHNFVQSPSPWLVPYIQLGAGGLGNDIFHDSSQTRIGEEFEFTLHAGAGLKWVLSDHWGLITEGEYRHISNAGLSSRNSGLDSFGAEIGLNYFF